MRAFELCDGCYGSCQTYCHLELARERRNGKTFQDVADGKGNWVMFDLPVPLEPVILDIWRPLEEQLPPGRYLDAAKAMLKEFRERSAT